MKHVNGVLVRIAPSLLFVVALLLFVLQLLIVFLRTIENARMGWGFAGTVAWLQLLSEIVAAAFQPAILIALAAAVVHLGRLAGRR